jgi:hypothetical protein
MRNTLKNKKGVALATTVVVLVVITILTACLLMIVTFALRHSYKMSCRQQAYFTARSAALEFKDYIKRQGITSNLRDGWKIHGKVALESDQSVIDDTLGEFDIELARIKVGKVKNNWKIIATGYCDLGSYKTETNTAVVYITADELRSAKLKNRNMVLAGTIDDSNGGNQAKAAPQHFTSTTFYSIEQYCKENKGQNYDIKNTGSYTIPYSYYQDYKNSFTASELGGLEDSMTHLYSKGGTDVDLQASYYSGYLISNGDLKLVGVGATCYGIRVIGNFTMSGAGSNLRVYGDVYASGDIYMDGASTSQIYGDVYCGGTCHIENTYVYGNIYCCGYNKKQQGTWQKTDPVEVVDGGSLTQPQVMTQYNGAGVTRINEAQTARFLRDRNNNVVKTDPNTQGIWCAGFYSSGFNDGEWPNFSGVHETNQPATPLSGHILANGAPAENYRYLHFRSLDSDEMVSYRETLDQKLYDDVLGTGSEVTVNNKDEYISSSLNQPAQLTYDAASRSIMVTDSGYIDSNMEGGGFGGYKPVNQCAQYTQGRFVNCPTTNGNLHELFVNYSQGSNNLRGVLVIDARNKDIELFVRANQVIEMQNSDFSNQSFSSIAVIGDHAVRVILDTGAKFRLKYNQWGVFKINDLNTKQPVWPKMRKDDPNYTEQDQNDEPRFYLLSYKNNVQVYSEDSNFVGYVVIPNKDTNSTVSFQVSNDNRRFFGCVYAHNFVFYNSGQIKDNTYFCFVPPSEGVFNQNLISTGWVAISAMQGFIDNDADWDEVDSRSFLSSAMYKKGIKVTRDKVGTSTSEQYGSTRFFAFG